MTIPYGLHVSDGSGARFPNSGSIICDDLSYQIDFLHKSKAKALQAVLPDDQWPQWATTSQLTVTDLEKWNKRMAEK